MSEADLLPAFVEGIFSGDKSDTDLIGSRCTTCGRYQFPHADICPEDLSKTTRVSIGRTGTLYSYTVVRTKPPFGLPAPYALGYVDLDDVGLRVLMLLDAARIDDMRIGIPLRLTSDRMGVGLDGQICRRPFFTPADERN
ncbi:MAG: Zn-ribbon domain-containing OB-fold protein [Thermomicrobiales bacterium]